MISVLLCWIMSRMSVKGADRLDLVFDTYVERFVKDSERKRRQAVAPLEMNVINSHTPLPVEIDRFWSSANNKLKPLILLHSCALKRGIQYTVVCNCKNCGDQRCICRKHGLSCLQFCTCHSLLDDAEDVRQCGNPCGVVQ